MKKYLSISIMTFAFFILSSSTVYAQVPGNALGFDGSNDVVVIPDHNSLDMTTSYTLEAWVKMNTLKYSGIISKYHTSGQIGYYLRLKSASPYNQFNLDGMIGGPTLVTGRWYHVAAVNNGGTRKLYVNGVEYALTGTPSTVVATTDNLRIGEDYHSANNRYFDGSIDEVRLWNIARTQTSIQNSMNDHLIGNENGLVAYYRFNHGTAGGDNAGITTLADSTANGHDGTLTNFALTGNTSNWIESYAMLKPAANAATNIAGTSFTANWSAPSIGGTPSKYYLDVDDNSDFASPVTGYDNLDVGNVLTYNVTGLTGSTYYYRVRAYKDAVTGSSQHSNSITVILSPTTQASEIVFSSVGAQQFTINWTDGNGAKRAVFVKQATAGEAIPQNSTTYTANTAFGSGSQVGTTGWYCVFNGTTHTGGVTVTGLASITEYRAMVCEYNGTAGSEIYNTSTSTNNPKNQITDTTRQASEIVFSSMGTQQFTINWTDGNGAKRAVFVKQATAGQAIPQNSTTYTANTAFGSGTQIGATGWYCVFNGATHVGGVTVAGLTSGTEYRAMVCEYNGTAGSEVYNTSTGTNNPKNQITDTSQQTIQASEIVFSSVGTQQFTINWTDGDGASRAVFVKRATTGQAIPQNNTTYTANTAFGSGSQIGTTGWYCVFNGTTHTGGVTVTGLTSTTEYRAMVCEYNGTAGSEVYNASTSTNNPKNQITSAPTPSIQASNLTFSSVVVEQFNINWGNGNGAKRAVFVKQATTGEAIPQNSTTYSANTAFGSGSQIGTTGWYCVFNGTSHTDGVTVTGLTSSTEYRAMVCEYNGTAGSEVYNTSTSTDNPKNQITEASQQTIFYVTQTGAGDNNGVNWTNAYSGDSLQSAINQTGNHRVWVAKGTYKPTTGTNRTASFQMKQGVAIYGGFAGTESDQAERNNFGAGEANETILSGDIGTIDSSADNCYHVIWVPSGLTAVSVLDGFTITGGNADGASSPLYYGGGICMNGSSPTLNDLVITNNSARYYGGGIYSYLGGPTIKNCVISYNTVTYAGGGGGGIWSSGSIRNCLIIRNTATEGGGIICELEQPIITNCTIALNSASSGGGLYVSEKQSPTVNNCIIWGNSSTQIAIEQDGTLYLNNSCYSNISNGGDLFESNNITVDPGFIDSTTDDFRIFGTSLCTEAGNNSYISETYDIRGAGYPRKLNKSTGDSGAVDMGAYEYKPGYDPPPSAMQAHNITFSSIGQTECTMNWTDGDGSQRAVFAKQTSSGNAIPVDSTTYTANTVFGSGSQIGISGWFCVFNGTSHTSGVTLTGLTQGTNYRVMVCEYDGSAGSEEYNTSVDTDNPRTLATASPPMSPPGDAINFDGINDVVVIPDHNSLDLTTLYTLEAWVKIGALKFAGIISKYHTSGIIGYYLRLKSVSPNDQFNFDGMIGGPTLVTGRWYHVAAVNDEGTRKLYVNGVECALTGTPNTVVATADDLRIGEDFHTNGNRFFNGSIDEVRIWNAALSETVIRDWMCKKATNTHPNWSALKGYWRFDESTGDTTKDHGGNQNIGVLTSGPTRIRSGAAIGDTSSYDYAGTNPSDFSASISHTDGDQFAASGDGGTVAGIQVYRVDTTSMRTDATKPGDSWLMDQNRYWGVFITGTSPTYTVTYNYSGHSGITDESDLGLACRDDQSDNSWADVDAILNTGDNTLTKTGQSGTEYAIGSRTGGNPLPVQLVSFTASVNGRQATLQWSTVTETRNYGFEVERRKIVRDQSAVSNETSPLRSGWNTIGFMKGNGTSHTEHLYTFTDSKLAAGRYEYRLKQIDLDGSFKHSQSVEIEISVPKAFSLSQNYPNPFNPTTNIKFDIPDHGATQFIVSLKIFDILGKEVATLVNETKEPGSYEVEFNASKLANGMYFYRFQVGSFTAVNKLVLMK